MDTDRVRSIAREAYIYGYPLVDNCRFLHARSIDTESPAYGAPLNHFAHDADVMKAGQAAVQTVNADTPYSRATLDLRAEPIVLTTPSLEPGHYFTVQLVDPYTFNFAHLGTRTTGNDGGSDPMPASLARRWPTCAPEAGRGLADPAGHAQTPDVVEPAWQPLHAAGSFLGLTIADTFALASRRSRHIWSGPSGWRRWSAST